MALFESKPRSFPLGGEPAAFIDFREAEMEEAEAYEGQRDTIFSRRKNRTLGPEDWKKVAKLQMEFALSLITSLRNVDIRDAGGIRPAEWPADKSVILVQKAIPVGLWRSFRDLVMRITWPSGHEAYHGASEEETPPN